jgi:hypothetical protein
MLRIIIGVIAIITIISCSKEKSNKAIISEEEMIELLVDIHKTDALLTRAVNRGEIKNDEVIEYYKGMFEKHNITREEFDSAFDYYSHDFKRFEKMYSNVVIKLQQQEDTLKHVKKND